MMMMMMMMDFVSNLEWHGKATWCTCQECDARWELGRMTQCTVNYGDPYILFILCIYIYICIPTALRWSDGLALHGCSDRFVQKHPPGPAEHFPLHAPRPSGFEARWTAAEVVVGSCQRLWTHPSLCDSHLVYGGDLENKKMVTVGRQKRQVRFNMKG